MQVTVKFFSLFRQISGTDQLLVDLTEGSSVSVLLETLSKNFKNPVLNSDQTSIMVNHKVVIPDTTLKEGDQVLLLPIMEGG